ncbi:CPBP family intramembrane metalloprotease [Loigolactobacillus coryniformis]|uniref:CPBP family intramembrane glutamic endopeptidase n=1 Tax=Loigolactobacillus coryniformis TaxID=1610 RepID=UPI00234277A3|nr:type II CAAX endopeptidase family protein [Loigolactobacillus coryniformis]MDC4186000.1 CPBP family intramembrane metalloprotease [Loigolactobacillus coryniformis]
MGLLRFKSALHNTIIIFGLFALGFVIQLNGASLLFRTVSFWTFFYMVVIFLILSRTLWKLSQQLDLHLVNARFTLSMGLWAALLAVLLTVSAICLSLIFPGDHGSNQFIAQQFSSHKQLKFLVTFMTINLTGPILEEMLFRGLILPFISRISHSWVIGLVVSSIVFAYLHNSDPFDPIYLIAGLGFGYLFIRSKNIGTAILCHQLVNILATIQLFI